MTKYIVALMVFMMAGCGGLTYQKGSFLRSGKAHQYTNANWGITAVFPYDVKEVPGMMKNGFMVQSFDKDETIAYTIAAFIVPDDVLARKGVNGVLDYAVNSVVIGSNGILAFNRVIKLHNYPGRHYQVNTRTIIFEDCLYLVDNRMYFVAVAYKNGAILPISTELFYSMFDVK